MPTLEEVRAQKAQVESDRETVRKEMVTNYEQYVTYANEVAAAYKEEFGTRVPSAYSVVEVNAGSTVGRQIGGLKRALAAATKRQDAAKVDELENAIAKLTNPV